MPSIRGKVTTAPALVEGVIDATNAKRNDSVEALQVKMETASQWLDEAINSAKRKINEGAEVSIHDVKKPKTTTFAKETSFKQKESNLSPIRSVDKENSPNTKENLDSQHVRIKPPPSAVKRKVDGMRVVDLRKELKDYGKETKGLKKDLQQRLLQAYTTVEKIMSPQKAERNPKEPDEPPKENFSDSDSVEMVVFEKISKNNGFEDEGKEHNEIQEGRNSGSEAPDDDVGETDENMPSLQSTTASPEVVKDELYLEHKSQEKEAAMKDEVANNCEAEKKRLSMMDCTDLEDSVPPFVSEEGPLVSNYSSPSLEKRSATDVTMHVEQMRIERPDGHSEQQENQGKMHNIGAVASNKVSSFEKLTQASRKVSQDSMSEMSQGSLNNVESNEKMGSNHELKPDKTNKDDEKDVPEKLNKEVEQASRSTRLSPSQQVETTSTSPIRRVKDAIQMFTAKSPPRSKATTTTTKLAWLNKSKFQKLKSSSSLEEIPSEQSDVKKTGEDQAKLQRLKASSSLEEAKVSSDNEVMATPSEKPEVMTTGKAIRRPGMGLYSNKATSSALKSSNKYLLAQPSSTLSANAKATNDARKARLAEIRGKSKAASNPKTISASKDQTRAFSSLKPTVSAGSESKETKRKLLTAQMREKAAARKQQVGASAVKISSVAATNVQTSTSTNDSGAQKMTNSVENGAEKSTVDAKSLVESDTNSIFGNEKEPAALLSSQKLSDAPKTETDIPMSTQKVVQDCIEEPKLQMPAQQVAETVAKDSQVPIAEKKTTETPAREAQTVVENGTNQPQALSPLDTYEISDREDSESESESESESDEEKNPRKKIPDWAQRANLLPALEKQFAQGARRIDPDEIFPEVQTCDLQAIFSSKRSRYIRRTSSANWSRDKVTPCEQLAYKRAMGFSNKR